MNRTTLPCHAILFENVCTYTKHTEDKIKDEKASVCRVCLNYNLENTKCMTLFEKYNDVYVYEKLNYIANIHIAEGDNLPDKICSSCFEALDAACNFKAKCEHSDIILHSESKLEPLNNTIQNNTPIKEEAEDKYEYVYLDGDVLSPPYLPDTDDVKQFSEPKPFKSKAIDLKLECHDCHGSFKSKCKLRVHWKQVHLPEQLTCPICKKILKTYKAFHSHLKRKSRRCINASKMRVEGKGASQVYYCKECNARSSHVQSMLAHIVIHTGERPFSCDICNKTFTQYSSLTSHKETAHKLYRKEGTCHQCGKYFKGRINLYRHMRTHSNEQLPCKICNRVLKNKTILKYHMKRHSKIKPYTCEMCAKTFYTSGDLCNHKTQVHKKKRIYTCDLCEYKTSNSTCMSRHRPRHSDDNVACDVCGRFVDNLQQLVIHKKRHFEKNFQCSYCDNRYYGRKNLNAHVRKKHNVYVSVLAKNSSVNTFKDEKVQSVPTILS